MFTVFTVFTREHERPECGGQSKKIRSLLLPALIGVGGAH
jgi:hypothetical protein